VYGLQVNAPAGQPWPAEARWRVQGFHDWKLAGEAVSELGAGDYTVEFLPVEGYLTPAPRLVSVDDATALTVAYERVSRGNKELMLIAGPSGTGKTALVLEAGEEFARRRFNVIHKRLSLFAQN
jgi:hypothetical protein